MEDFLGRDAGGRSSMIWRGCSALVMIAIAIALTTAYTRGFFGNTMEVDAVIDNAGGSLSPGADVKARGVLVGKATSIRLVGNTVHLTLRLDKKTAERIPSGVTARVLPATVFGTSFVELMMPGHGVAGHGDGGVLKAGQEIAQDKTQATLELQTTLDSIYRVVTAVHPAELATTLEAMSMALKGRGNDLGQSMESLENYLARLNPHLPLLQEDLRMLATNLETVNRN
ncbi:MAG: MCE family protein, partial [Aeromicrobium sp.]